MEVKREVAIQTNELNVGDRIRVDLPKEEHMATAINRERNGMLFLFDNYLNEERQIDSEMYYKGGYDASEMRNFLQRLEKIFPKTLRSQMVPFENGDLIRLLSAKEMFGINDDGLQGRWSIEWMKNQQHRIAYRKSHGYEWGDWGWTETSNSEGNFYIVDYSGTISLASPNHFYGVRPVFKICLK